MDDGKPKGFNKMPATAVEGRSLHRRALLSLLALFGRLQYDAHVSSLRYWGPVLQTTAGANATGSWRATPGLANRTSSPLQMSRNRPCRLSGTEGLPVPPLWGVTATHLSCRLKLPTLAATMFRQRQCLDTLSVRAARETGLTSDTDPSVFAHPNRWAFWCHGGTRSFCSSLCLGRSPAHRTWTPWTEALPGPLWHLLLTESCLEDPSARPSPGMLLIKILHQCTMPLSVLQLDYPLPWPCSLYRSL